MNDEEAMDIALQEARLAYEEGEVPVGAVILYNGALLARAHNSRETDLDISGHAEIKAMQLAAKRRETWLLEGCKLIVTLEPCPMCAGAILQSRLSYLCFGAKDEKEGAIVSAYHLFDSKKDAPLTSFGLKEDECSMILKDFFARKRT